MKPSFPYLKAASPPWKKPGQAVCRARKDESQEMRLYHDSGMGQASPKAGRVSSMSVSPCQDQRLHCAKEIRGARGSLSSWVWSRRTIREDQITRIKISNKKRVSLCQLCTPCRPGPPDWCSAYWDVQQHSEIVKLCLSSYPRNLSNEFQPTE